MVWRYPEGGDSGDYRSRWHPHLEGVLKSRQDEASVRGLHALLLALHRCDLGDRRIADLKADLHLTRDRLLNVPWFVDQAEVRSLEERVLSLKSDIHQERVSVWASLRDLSRPLHDAWLAYVRAGWINALLSQSSASEVNPYEQQ